MTFPNVLSAEAVESLEKVLPGRPGIEFNGEEEETMLEVSFYQHRACTLCTLSGLLDISLVIQYVRKFYT